MSMPTRIINSFGWHEGRDPSAFFSTAIYLSANPDVKAAGVNPLDHFDAAGWQEGRVPSIAFDPAQYLAANPDVAAAHVDPLRHFLQFGDQEGRQPFAPTELIAANGFDFVYYLNHNPDVAAAGVDPFQHFQTVGWKEGRNPNALFDINGYLATYADVAAAHVNPLDHYNPFGWHEGRDPSVGFDTTAYLAAYPTWPPRMSTRSALPPFRHPRGPLALRRRRVGVTPRLDAETASSPGPGRRLAARIVVRAEIRCVLCRSASFRSLGRWCFFNRSPNASSASS